MSAPARPRAELTWNLLDRSPADIAVEPEGLEPVTPEWAWEGGAGRGVRVCVLDSGIEPDHPMVGAIQGWFAARADDAGTVRVLDSEPGDTSGHGTACAGVIRRLAPECDIYSVQVLNQFAGSGDALLAGLSWAIEQRFDVINLSLSTSRRSLAEVLHAMADDAYFTRSVLVASAHNMRLESYPWRFSSVLSVGSHAEPSPELFYYNPTPPVEFFACGSQVDVAWLNGGTARVTGNSFATPHITGYCARVLGKHPRLTSFQLKNILYLTAANVRGNP